MLVSESKRGQEKKGRESGGRGGGMGEACREAGLPDSRNDFQF